MATILQAFEPPHGGVPAHVTRLCEGLAERGHRLVVAGPPESQFYPRLEQAGVEVHRLSLEGSIFAARADRAAAASLRHLLDCGGFDLAHAHGMKAGVLLRRLCPPRRIPVVYTPHCFAFISNRYRESLRLRPIRQAVAVGTEWALGRVTAALVCVSEFERREADRFHIARPARRHVIPNGVEVDDSLPADPAMADWRGEGLLFGQVCVLRWEKGMRHVVEAAELLRDDEGAPRLAVVGEGPEREAVGRLIAEAGLTDRVRLFEWSGRVEPHLKALQCYLLPSDSFEALPIGAIEAMACGLPVIASRVGGVPEAVIDGETGLLVPPGDAVALSEAIRTVAADAALRARFAARGKQLARERFSLAGMVDRLEALYAEVAGPSPRGGESVGSRRGALVRRRSRRGRATRPAP